MSSPARSKSRDEWVRLRLPPASSAIGTGCVGLGCLLVGAGFALAALAATVASGSLPVFLFVMIGLLVAAPGALQILAALGPRPHLWTDRIKVEAGETFNLRWEASGRFKRASSIEITWEGREVAITRAYDPIHHRSSFVTRVITSDMGPLAGRASVALSQHAMPSFAAGNARIEWRLLAKVKTDRWPNVDEEYTIAILPSRMGPR